MPFRKRKEKLREFLKPYPMAWSTSDPSNIDVRGAAIDGNTIITYLETYI